MFSFLEGHLLALTVMLAGLISRVLLAYWQFDKSFKLKTVSKAMELRRIKGRIIGACKLLIAVPLSEELVFRAPLVLVFESLTPAARVAVLLSALAFAMVHVYGSWGEKSKSMYAQHLFWQRYEAGLLKDEEFWKDLREIRNLAEQWASQNAFQVYLVDGIQFVAPLVMGAIAGYVGIKEQSLWWPIAIHSVSNATVSLLLGCVAERVILRKL